MKKTIIKTTTIMLLLGLLAYFTIESQAKSDFTLDETDNFEKERKEITQLVDSYRQFDAFTLQEPIVVRLADNSLNQNPPLDPGYIKKFMPSGKSLHHTTVQKIQKKRVSFSNQKYAFDVIEAFLYRLYIGRGEEAMRLVHQYLKFESREAEEIFFRSLLNALLKSRFCRQINDLTMAKYGLSIRELFLPDLEHFFVYHEIGSAFEEGKELKEDYAKAMYYYKKGCIVGHGYACLNLAQMYLNGRGVVKNDENASYYFEKACDYGYAQGCLHWNILNGYAPELP